MLQHRQPLASSKTSSDDSARGSDVDETLIALAVLSSHNCSQQDVVAGQTFDILDKNEKLYAETRLGAYSCVPKFVHDDCNAVSMLLSEDAPKINDNPLRICVRGRQWDTL
jgi:hypothetical protein